jgi:hypothetical protein
MREVIKQITDWLKAELTRLPPHLTAVYVEFTEGTGADGKKTIYFDAFGFEDLADGAFNPSNDEHVAQLGDFVWEGREHPSFSAAEYPAVDWLTALTTAAEKQAVQQVAQARKLQLLVGEHDGGVVVTGSG